MLQCGRTFSSAEVKRKVSTMTKHDELQCGRTFSSAEVSRSRGITQCQSSLQCGRTFSSAEVSGNPEISTNSRRASMWPHFFKCGSPAFRMPVSASPPVASMWPHFFKCGSQLDQIRIQQSHHSFNVAALFQVRKFKLYLTSICLIWMLQCGRTFSSAEV